MVNNFSKQGRPLTDLGLPADVSHIDAAFESPSDGLVYLLHGSSWSTLNQTTESGSGQLVTTGGQGRSSGVDLRSLATFDAAFNDWGGKEGRSRVWLGVRICRQLTESPCRQVSQLVDSRVLSNPPSPRFQSVARSLGFYNHDYARVKIKVSRAYLETVRVHLSITLNRRII